MSLLNGKIDPTSNIVILGVSLKHWVYGLGAIFLFLFRSKIGAWIAGISAVNLATSDINNYVSSGQTKTEVTSVNPAQVARNCYDAIWNHSFGMLEDETAFLESLLSCPKELIYKLAIEYAKIDSKGKNIYTDAKKYLSDTDYLKVKYLLS